MLSASDRIAATMNRMWHRAHPPEPVDATRRVFLSDTEVTQVTAIFDRPMP